MEAGQLHDHKPQFCDHWLPGRPRARSVAPGATPDGPRFGDSGGLLLTASSGGGVDAPAAEGPFASGTGLQVLEEPLGILPPAATVTADPLRASSAPTRAVCGACLGGGPAQASPAQARRRLGQAPGAACPGRLGARSGHPAFARPRCRNPGVARISGSDPGIFGCSNLIQPLGSDPRVRGALDLIQTRGSDPTPQI